jgi:hypothetical protein
VRVIGKVNPLIEKTAPVTFACVMVTDDPPVLVSVSDKLVLLPTWTLPNARLVGLAAKAPGATPVADSGRFRAELEALEEKVMLPLELPAD